MKKLLRQINKQASNSVKHHPRLIPLTLFIICTTIYTSSMVGIMNSADGTQYALTKSLIEEKSIYIDKYLQYTYFTDFAFYKGHYFSDRGIGQSIFGVPFYIYGKFIIPFARNPFNGPGDGVNQESKIQIFTVYSAAFFGAGAVVLVYLIAKAVSKSFFASLITALTFGLGTLHWKYSTSYVRQPLLTFFLLGSVYLLMVLEKKGHIKVLSTFLFGLFLGFTFIIDTSMIPTTIILLIFFFITRFKSSQKLKASLLIFSGMMLPLAIHGMYNVKAFGKPFTNAYFFEVNKKWSFMKDLNKLFQTPLLPSLKTNFFSSKPVPQEVIAPFIWQNEELRYQTSANWATKKQYKGIFTQSPVLFLSYLGLLFIARNKIKYFILSLLLFYAVVFIQAKYAMFYSANNYDTRLFLPAVPLLLVWLSLCWKKALSATSVTKLIYVIIIVTFTVISLYNGWYSTITHYAPNVTGEYRFNFDQLIQPWYFSWGIIRYNLWLLFINTFPNIFNVHLLFTFFFLPILFIHLLHRMFTKLTTTHE